MITDRDIWRTARGLIQEFCDDAHIHAAVNADDSVAEGDIDGHFVWMRVLKAINEIRCTVPVEGVEGERLNWHALG